MLCHLASVGNLPRNLGALFRNIAEEWAQHETIKHETQGVRPPSKILVPDGYTKTQYGLRKGELLAALAEIGYVISNARGFGTYIDRVDLLEELHRLGLAERTRQMAVDMAIDGGMLEQSETAAGKVAVRFFHHKFQEYFAAAALEQRLVDKVLPYARLGDMR